MNDFYGKDTSDAGEWICRGKRRHEQGYHCGYWSRKMATQVIFSLLKLVCWSFNVRIYKNPTSYRNSKLKSHAIYLMGKDINDDIGEKCSSQIKLHAFIKSPLDGKIVNSRWSYTYRINVNKIGCSLLKFLTSILFFCCGLVYPK